VPKLNPNTPTLMDGEVRLFKRKYSKMWPHGALDYSPPALESIVPVDQKPTMH